MTQDGKRSHGQPIVTDMASARNRGWSPTVGFFIALWLGLLYAGQTRMLRDPGTLWHTVVGEQMLQTGQLVHSDTFSFTQSGQDWIAQQWLGECAMALVHRLAGLDGLALAAVTLLAGLFALLAGRFIRAGLPWPAVTLLLMLIIAASSYHFIPRPHLVTIALMAWTMALLCDVEAGRISPSRLLLLPPVFVLWTNIHGGVLGGIATTFIVMMAWLLRPAGGWHVEGDRKRPASPLMIAVTLSLSFAAVLVNPYGPSLPRVWLSLMNSDVLPRLIIEHAPLRLLSLEGLMFCLLSAAYVVVLAKTCRRGVRVTWLLPLVWLALAYSRIRHGPLFAVVAAVAMADMLGMAKSELRIAKAPQSTRSSRGSPSSFRHSPFAIRYSPLAIPAALVLLALSLQAAGIRCPIIGSGWFRLDPKVWPVEATVALKEHMGESPEDRRVFNDMRFGGYLIYRAADARIYIDDRCELYREHGLRRYVELRKNPALIEGLAAYRDVHWAMVGTRSSMARYLNESPAWTKLHRDATASLFRRIPNQPNG